MDVANVSTEAAAWEKVVRKLRSAPCRRQVGRGPTMPPLMRSRRRSRPARPRHCGRAQSGSEPAVHRLTRTEYQNAIRDLLALEELPKEMDLDAACRPTTASGFDTVAEALFVTPTPLEGYLSAARKISRIAVGDASRPQIVDTYSLPLELPQDDQFDDLPFGTRGGIAIRRNFPLDGDYDLKLETGGRVASSTSWRSASTASGSSCSRSATAPPGRPRALIRRWRWRVGGSDCGPRRAAHRGGGLREEDLGRKRGAGRPFLRGRGEQPWWRG